jgi:hypothetical protein
MATMSSMHARKGAWHVRGAWRSQDDRVPSAVWLGLLWLGLLAGFGVDIPRYLGESPAAPRIVDVHAAVFTVWMLILTAQVTLVLGNRVSWHRTLGWFAAGWACLMAVLGPVAAMASQVAHLPSPLLPPPFISVHLVDMGGFLVLLGWALALRSNPAAHKRMMILATASLTGDPGYSRFSGWLWPHEPTSLAVWFLWMFYGNVLLVALMVGWDWWRGRLIRSAVVAATALIAAEYAASALYFWEPWRSLTTGWVAAYARYFG